MLGNDWIFRPFLRMDTIRNYAGQVRIWSWFDDFWQTYICIPLEENFSFHSLNFFFFGCRYDWNCICKYFVGMHRSNLNLVMVRWFFDRVIPFGEIFSFRTLSFLWIYVWCWDCIYCVNTSFECAGQVYIGYGPTIFLQLSLMNLVKKTWNFQFPLSNFFRDVRIKLKLHMKTFYKKIQVKFRFGRGIMIFDNCPPLMWKRLNMA
jgi:hypothetical protein